MFSYSKVAHANAVWPTADVGIELDRPFRRRHRLWFRLRASRGPGVRQHGQRVGDAGPGQRIAGVELDCRPKQVEPGRDARSPPIDQRAALQIELIRLDIRRRLFDQPIVFATGEGHPQSLGDRLRNLILHVEDVFQLTVVPLRPQLKAIGHVAQLHGDAHAIPGSPHAAFEHRRHVQLLADGPKVVALALEGERRRARGDPQTLERRQSVENFLGDAVAEPVLILRGAHVGEGQHGDRRAAGQRLGGRRRNRIVDLQSSAGRRIEPSLAILFQTPAQ